MNDQPYINEDVLKSFGITVSDADKESLIDHLNDTLQERVGTEIASMLDDTKLEALVELQETGTNEQVGAWLSENVPELKEIVEDEIAILMGELADSRDDINHVQ